MTVVSVRRPKAIIFDILGTASKSGFLEKVLFPFLKVNLEGFVTTSWSRKDFVKLHNKIMLQSQEFHKQDQNTPLVLPHEAEGAKSSLINFINFVTENGINAPSVTQLRFKVWFEGYQQSKLRTPIYSDVPTRMKQWFAEGVKFYVFSNTWVEAQKALLRNTNHGDMTNLISGHFDNEFGALLQPDTWVRLCTEIKENPNDVLFLTKSVQEGHAAAEAGLGVVLVLTHRHNVKAVSKEDRTRFPFVRTLNDLIWAEGSMMPAQGEATPDTPMPTAMSNTTAVSGSGQPLVGASNATGPQPSGTSSVNTTHGGVSTMPPTQSNVANSTAVSMRSGSHSRTSQQHHHH